MAVGSSVVLVSPFGGVNGSANASRNPSAGPRPSAVDDNSATEAETATGPWFKITAAVYNLIRITTLDTKRALA